MASTAAQLLVTVLAPIGILIYLGRGSAAGGGDGRARAGAPGTLALRKATSSSGNWHWRAYAASLHLVLDSLQDFNVKSLRALKARGREIAEQSETLYRATMRILAVNLWSTGVMDLAIAGGAAVALAVGALRAVEGHIGVGSLLIIFLLGNEVFRPVRELGRLYHQGLNGVSAAQGMQGSLLNQRWLSQPTRWRRAGRRSPSASRG
jgi:ATP-binding cassette subfamily C protein CydCD